MVFVTASISSPLVVVESMPPKYVRASARSSSKGRIRAHRNRRFGLLLWSEAAAALLGYVELVRRLRSLARRYGFDAVIALIALESALEVALRQDPSAAPRTAHWFAAPAIALVVLPLLARRRFPLAGRLCVHPGPVHDRLARRLRIARAGRAGGGRRGARDPGRAGTRDGRPHRRGRGARPHRARAARRRRPRGQRD